jgi:hypothetical protein
MMERRDSEIRLLLPDAASRAQFDANVARQSRPLNSRGER